MGCGESIRLNPPSNPAVERTRTLRPLQSSVCTRWRRGDGGCIFKKILLLCKRRAKAWWRRLAGDDYCCSSVRPGFRSGRPLRDPFGAALKGGKVVVYILLLSVACIDGLMYICTLHYLTGMLYSRKWYKLDIFLSTYISFAVSSWICTNLMCVNVPPCLAVGILKT